MKVIIRTVAICIVATAMLGAAVTFMGCDKPEPNTYSEPVVLSPEQYPDGLDEAIVDALYSYYDPIVKDLWCHFEMHEIMLVEERIISEEQKELTVYALVAYQAYSGDRLLDYCRNNTSNMKPLLYNYNNEGVDIKGMLGDEKIVSSLRPDCSKSCMMKIKLDVLPDNTVGTTKEVYMSGRDSDKIFEKCTTNTEIEWCIRDGYFYPSLYGKLYYDELKEKAVNWYMYERGPIAVEIMNDQLYDMSELPEEASLIRLYSGSTKFEIIKVTESGNADEDAEFEDRIKREVVCEGTCVKDRGYLIMTSTEGKTYTFKLTSFMPNLDKSIELDLISKRSDEFFFNETTYKYIYLTR